MPTSSSTANSGAENPFVHIGQRDMDQVIRHLLGQFTTWRRRRVSRPARGLASGGVYKTHRGFSLSLFWLRGSLTDAGFMMAGFWPRMSSDVRQNVGNGTARETIMKRNILFVHNLPTKFVQIDLALLRARYEVHEWYERVESSTSLRSRMPSSKAISSLPGSQAGIAFSRCSWPRVRSAVRIGCRGL